MSYDTKPQMVPGFNHNIKHNGLIYHVQTEDSGAANPHVITHLFVGGNILATKKTSYADIVHADNLHSIVRELMQAQHKAMMRNLINGVYDNIGTTPTEPPPVETAAAAQPAALPARPAQQAPATPSSPPPQTAGEAQDAAARVVQPLPAPPVSVTARPAGERQPVTLPLKPRPAPKLGPGKFPLPAGSAGGFSRPITGTQIHKPPAPEKVPVIATPSARVTLRPRQAAASGVQTGEGQLPPEVLAARRLADKPKPKSISGPTLFGESLITEKSLDEVILGYLAGNEEGGG